MLFQVVTLFPELFAAWLETSVIGRARAAGIFEVEFLQLRDFADNRWGKVDDAPFGGGAGMVLSPEPVARAVEKAKERDPAAPVIFFSPGGRRLKQTRVEKLAAAAEKGRGAILLCGRFEGLDQRVRDLLVDEEISLGDFVLAGGELAALAFLEAGLRLLPGVLGNEESAKEESFSAALARKKEFPQFTRPAEWRRKKVPEILLSGNHAEVARWREENCG